MVPHVSKTAAGALLRAHCAGTSCRAARTHSRLRPATCQPKPYSTSALALTSARPALQTARARLDANEAPRSQARRAYATAPAPGPELPKDIAVLGGGLTGLTTAYYLTRFHPNARITLYESEARLGGWIDTEQFEAIFEGGKTATINFERGARVVSPQSTLTRWEDFVLFDLIDQLDLVHEAHAVPKDDPVLGSRYVYYPDHLVSIPGNLPSTFFERLRWFSMVAYQILTEPVYTGVVGSAISMLAASNTQDLEQAKQATAEGDSARLHAIADIKDLSMGDFFQSRMGRPDVIDNLMSALVHGIWGGDVWKLSMREGTFQQAVIQSQHGGTPLIAVKDHDYFSGQDVAARNKAVLRLAANFGPKIGYIGFRNGFSSLTDVLVDTLRSNPNVTIKTCTPVTSIRHEQGKAVVSAPGEPGSTEDGETRYDKVISSLYSGDLAKLTGDALPTLKKHSTAVTIQIVNLWYPDPTLTRQHPGFGYLIPQSVPAENNPHAALGVIFDSDREAAAKIPEHTFAPSTKLTVMLGGHYWDHLDADSWPDANEATAMAMDTVHRQLGIPPTKAVFTSTKVCRNCIPQHLVGHRERMAQAHTELYDAFRGTLAVVGSSYSSPGVLPSLKAARDMALQVSGQGYKLKDGTEYDMVHVGQTGLGRFFGRTETYRLRDRKKLPYRFGNTDAMRDDSWLA